MGNGEKKIPSGLACLRGIDRVLIHQKVELLEGELTLQITMKFHT